MGLGQGWWGLASGDGGGGCCCFEILLESTHRGFVQGKRRWPGCLFIYKILLICLILGVQLHNGISLFIKYIETQPGTSHFLNNIKEMDIS